MANEFKIKHGLIVSGSADITGTITATNFIGSTGAYLPLAGGDMTGATTRGDSIHSYWGTSNDLDIYHDNTFGSIIRDRGAGDLGIESNQAIRFRKSSTTELMTLMVPDGAVSLYYDNSKKFETTSTGITVTGGWVTDGVSVATANVEHTDNSKALFGNGNDLQIYHDGSNDYIVSNGTYNIFEANNHIFRNLASNEDYAKFIGNGGVELYHNNVKRFETTSTGVTVTGDVQIPQNEYIYFDNTGHYIRRGASNVELQGFNGLDLRTNGSTRLFINQTGNVGIGTTSPDALLHVRAATNVTGTIEVQGGKATVTSAGEINSELNFGSNDSSATGGIGGSIKSVTENTNGAYVGMSFYTARQGRTPVLQKAMQIANTGAIAFGANAGDYGSAGEILVSNGNASPTWDAASTVIGGPYLPLAGGTLSGNLELGANNVNFADNGKARFGNSTDLQIYHDGANSRIDETGTGSLIVKTGALLIRNPSDASMIDAQSGGTVNLYYNGSKKFETTSTGVTVTGLMQASTVGVTNIVTNKVIKFNGSVLDDSNITDTGSLITLGSAVTATSTVTATTFLGDLNGTINTATTAATQVNATNNTTVATTAFVQNLIGTIPAGLVFQGTWNAATNTPTLANGSGTTGHFYIVSVDGTTNLDGITDWKVGDWAVFVEQGATDAWEKVDNSSVLDGAGTGTRLAKWDGSGTSNTLTNSGIQDSSNAVAITINGNEEVGIGTTSPFSVLHTRTSAENVGRFESTDATAYIQINDNIDSFYVATGTQYGSIGGNPGLNANNLNISLTTGNVGIGTTSPQKKLDVYLGTDNAVASIGGGIGNGEYAGLHFGYSEAANSLYRKSAIVFERTDLTSGNAQGKVHILNGPQTGPGSATLADAKLSIIENGNVGIGTTNPGKKLDIVSNTTYDGIQVSGTSIPRIAIVDTTNNATLSAYARDNDATIGTESNHPLTLNTNNTERARITSTGNVGIGTTSPTEKLEVVGQSRLGTSNTIVATVAADTLVVESSSSTQGGMSILGPNTAYQYLAFGSPSDSLGALARWNYGNSTLEIGTSAASGELIFLAGNSSQKMRITSAGNVGIGTTSPSAKLEVVGSAKITGGQTINLTTVNNTPSMTMTGYAVDTGFINIVNSNQPFFTLAIGGYTKGINYTGTYTRSTPGNAIDFLSIAPTYNTSGTFTGTIRGFYYNPTLTSLTGLTHRAIETTTGDVLLGTVSGNVGIGTTSPGQKLTVEGNIELGTGGYVYGDTTTPYLRLSNAAGTVLGYSTGNISLGPTFVYNTSSGEKFRINHSDGNVGIGTTSPQTKLAIGSAQGNGIQFNYDATNNYRHQILNYWNSNTDSRMDFNIARSSGQTPETIMSVGYGSNVGIGESAPAAKLEVAGGIIGSNARISLAQRTPVGHYTPGETVFEIDPTWDTGQLQSYFNSTNVTWTADADAPGGYAIYINGSVNVGGVYTSGFPYIPVDNDGVYYVECYIKNVGTGQQHYMGGNEFDEDFASTGGNPGSYAYFVMSNINPGSAWTKVSGYIGGFHASTTGKFELLTKYWTPMALFNYGAGTGTRACVISGWKIIRADSPGDRYFDGNVGIGTTSPENKLHLLTSTTDTTQQLLIQNGSSGDAAIKFNISGDSYSLGIDNSDGDKFKLSAGNLGTNDRLVIDSSGNVGIGTTSPGQKLDVAGNIKTNGEFQIFTGTTDIGQISNLSGALNIQGTSTRDVSLGSDTNPQSIFIEGSNGNVGIGTTTPQKKVHIEGPGGASASQLLVTGASDTVGSTAGILLRAEGGEGDSALRAKGGIFFEREAGSFGTGKMHLAVNGAQSNVSVTLAEAALTIDDGRNVGIGTTSPDRPLSVVGGNSMVARFQSTNTTSFIQFSNTVSTADQIRIGSNGTNLVLSTNYAERMRINSTGNVGIGTTSPAYPLHVNGQGLFGADFASGFYLSPANLTMYIGGNSSLTKSAASLIVGGANYTGLLFRQTAGYVIRTDSNGQVNIGGSAPTAKLQVIGRGTTSSTTTFLLENSAGTDLVKVTDDAAMTLGVDGTGVSFTAHSNTAGRALTWNKVTSALNLADNSAMKFGTGGDFNIAHNGSNTVFTCINGGIGFINYADDQDISFTIDQGGTTHQLMTLDGSANSVGIGTTAPSGKLHVKSAFAGSFTYDTTADDLIVESNANGGITIATAAANTGRVIFASPDDATGSEISFNSSGGLMKLGTTTGTGQLVLQSGNGSEALRINASGNVGIGTTTPLSALSLQGVANGSPAVITLANSVSSVGSSLGRLDFYGLTAGQGLGASIEGTRGNNYVSGNLLFKTGEGAGGVTEVMRITSTGNVGIGTTSPSAPLSLGNGGAESLEFNHNISSSSRILSYNRSNNTYRQLQLDALEHIFKTSSSEKMRITSAGNVGIGTTSPSQLLHVESTSTNARTVIKTTATGNFTAAAQIVCNDSDLFFGAADDGYTAVSEYTGKAFLQGNGGDFAIVNMTDDLEFYAGGRASTNKHMVVTAAGTVGIGTISPTAKLHVDGSLRVDDAGSGPPAGAPSTATLPTGPNPGQYLTAPDAWLNINIAGTAYVIPAFLP